MRTTHDYRRDGKKEREREVYVRSSRRRRGTFEM
jgi:hypothetical protein